MEQATQTQRSQLLAGRDRFEWEIAECGEGRILSRGDGFSGGTEHFDDAGVLVGATSFTDSPPRVDTFGRVPACNIGTRESLRPRALATLERAGGTIHITHRADRREVVLDEDGLPVVIGSDAGQLSGEVHFDSDPQQLVTLRIGNVPNGMTAARCVYPDDDRAGLVQALDAGAEISLPTCIALSTDGGFGAGYGVWFRSRWVVRDGGQ